VALFAAVAVGIVIILPATLLLPLTTRMVLLPTFVRARLGAPLADLLLLHARLPQLLTKQQLAAHTSRWVGVFIISTPFNRPLL
jgi:hypothetical protein